MESVKLEELRELLNEEGFTIFGHGTGGNNIEAVSSIFANGLRASHNSIFYTTIGLDVDKDLSKFKEKLDNWEHFDSENIILIKLPNKYFNMFGDSMDLDCERTGAFVNEKADSIGKVTYYLDPKFIIGAYNRNISGVVLNPNYEYKLTDESLEELEEKLELTITKTRNKNLRFEENMSLLNQNNDFKKQEESVTTFDMNSSIDDLNWDDDLQPLDEKHHKGR